MTALQGPQLDPITSVPRGPRPHGEQDFVKRTPHNIAYKTGSKTIIQKPGPTTFEEAQAWYDAQIPYENLAHIEDIAARAVFYVRERKRIFHDQTLPLRRRWRIINHMLHGNSVANFWALEELHVPELYKMLETMVPRIVDSIMDFDPPFTVVGRQRLDRAVEDILAAFLDYQMDEAKVRKILEPTVRCMLTYQFAAWKIDWERQFEWGVDVKIEEKHYPGQVNPEYHFTRNPRYKMKFDGPRVRLIDPFDFLIDLSALDAQDALFIGDSHDATQNELLQKSELGLYKNVNKVWQTTPQNEDTNSVSYDKWARSVASKFDQHRRDPKGSPKIYRETELHCKFDLYGDGQEIDCILNVVNDAVCVRAIENFYDKKFRPYAIARAAKEGFDFFNVGPLDHAVRLNEELDQHRALWLEGAKLKVCPIIVTEDDSDLPESLFGIRPGSVLHAPGKITQLTVSGNLEDVVMTEGTLRRDIEETVGSPRVWEGTGGGDAQTATEINRKIEEGNRRLKGYVRAFSDQIAESLQIIYFLNGQFITKKQQFHALGKAAKNLGKYLNVNPMHFQHEIDFEFKGLASMHTMGLRASALANYLQIAFPWYQVVKPNVDVAALLQDFYRLTVGIRPEDEIIKIPTPLDQLVLPEEENMMLMGGNPVEVDPLDDYETHQPSHINFYEEHKGKMTEEAKRATEEHIMNHYVQRERNTMQQQASMMSSPNVVQFPGADEDGQQSPVATEGGDMGGQQATTSPGESAGPESLFKIGVPGRQQGIFQSANQMRA